jgi:hypothetical protein
MLAQDSRRVVAQELKDLETRSDDELKDRWLSLYGTNPDQRVPVMTRQVPMPIQFVRAV